MSIFWSIQWVHTLSRYLLVCVDMTDINVREGPTFRVMCAKKVKHYILGGFLHAVLLWKHRRGHFVVFKCVCFFQGVCISIV